MRRTAAALAGQVPERLLTSPLPRSRVSAEIIANLLGIPVEVHDQLLPWHLGGLQGTRTESAQDDIEFLITHPLHPAPDGGESFYYSLMRLLPFVLPLVRDPAHLVGVMTHSRPTKALDSHLNAKGYGVDLNTWRRPCLLEPGGAALVDPRGFHVLYQPSEESVHAT